MRTGKRPREATRMMKTRAKMKTKMEIDGRDERVSK